MDVRKPRKLKLKYMGRLSEGRKYHSKKARMLCREMRSYPCIPSSAFLVKGDSIFPIEEIT